MGVEVEAHAQDPGLRHAFHATKMRPVRLVGGDSGSGSEREAERREDWMDGGGVGKGGGGPSAPAVEGRRGTRVGALFLLGSLSTSPRGLAMWVWLWETWYARLSSRARSVASASPSLALGGAGDEVRWGYSRPRMVSPAARRFWYASHAAHIASKVSRSSEVPAVCGAQPRRSSMTASRYMRFFMSLSMMKKC